MKAVTVYEGNKGWNEFKGKLKNNHFQSRFISNDYEFE